ncbi:34-kDa subunit of RNA polymerase III (C) [Lambiella insularis]|nr:34-kDa subunit of RNA polymerase III (C) [Lambiella insularis]
MATDMEDVHGMPIAPSSPKELANALYASCASQSADKTFNQEELLSLNIIPNNSLEQLVRCIDRLAKDGLLKIHTKEGKPCWKVVKKEDAKKYQNLNMEEALVYSYVESSGREGIWTRTIRSRTNLHQTTMNRCLKILESKALIKSIQSAKFPKRKIYILAKLQPSEDVTGGPFYTDGLLDEEFVFQLGIWAEKYVHGRSWYHPPTKALPRRKGKSKEDVENMRAQGLREPPQEKTMLPLLPMPAGYIGYPTVPEITKAINESGISGVVMKEAEMRQVMDVLCWDGRLMKVMDGKAYKTVRSDLKANTLRAENGLTESPCGRCPVFDLCEETGPVNARTCTYFQEWLA